MIVLPPLEMSSSDYFNGITNLFIFFVGIYTVSKYIVLYFIKGIIKFKILKNTRQLIEVKTYVFKK